MSRTFLAPSRDGRLALLLFTPLLLASGCNDQGDRTLTSSGEQEIIGGFAANDPRLDFVGSLVTTVQVPPGLLLPPGVRPPPPRYFCSASLLSPESVLTAKHCADSARSALRAGQTIAFALGPDSTNPRKMADVVAIEMAPGDVGGFVEMGRDIAVLHLDTPLTDEPTVTVAALSDAELGQPFAAMGYGAQDNSRRAGVRKLGRQTFKAREGKTLEALFGSFDVFLEWFKARRGVFAPVAGPDEAPVPTAVDAGPVPPIRTDAGPPIDVRPPFDGGGLPPDLEARARVIYDNLLLETTDEIVTGGIAGDSQPCYGDSGSPLVRKREGVTWAFGVVSGGVDSPDLVCDRGTVYAGFGPESLAFIERELTWQDPCGEISINGLCDGSVAKRCTGPGEGLRRVVEFDCNLLELACGGGGAQQVTCGGSPIAPARATPAAAPDLQRQVDDIFIAGPFRSLLH